VLVDATLSRNHGFGAAGGERVTSLAEVVDGFVHASFFAVARASLCSSFLMFFSIIAVGDCFIVYG